MEKVGEISNCKCIETGMDSQLKIPIAYTSQVLKILQELFWFKIDISCLSRYLDSRNQNLLLCIVTAVYFTNN